MRRTRRSRRDWLALVLALILPLAPPGCGSDPYAGRKPVFPVKGTVLWRGQPAADALVIFHAANESDSDPNAPRPNGRTDASGVFELSTYETNDGAPAGEFTVTVTMGGVPADESTGVTPRPDPLGGKFSNPETSGLHATVKPQRRNDLPPFRLGESP